MGIYQIPVGPVWECPLRFEHCGHCRAWLCESAQLRVLLPSSVPH